MQKYSADITSEQTVSVIALPNDEMKGRLLVEKEEILEQ